MNSKNHPPTIADGVVMLMNHLIEVHDRRRILLLSTIMLPNQVRLFPTYVFFNKPGWGDTLLPLSVPQFFANAYDVFLLRQFFITIPLELDDAAKIDGASPLQTLMYIIPQAHPALVSAAIFHFLYAWNDFYEPLIYLHRVWSLQASKVKQ